MILLAFKVFLALLGAMLVFCAIYIRLPLGARSTKAPVVMVAPTLPVAVAIPAKTRRVDHPKAWPC